MLDRESLRGVRGDGGGRSFKSRLGEDGERIGLSTFPMANVSSTIVIVDGRRPCPSRFCGGLDVEEPERRERRESPMSASSSMVVFR